MWHTHAAVEDIDADTAYFVSTSRFEAEAE